MTSTATTEHQSVATEAATRVENWTIAHAINEGLRAALGSDEKVLLMGQDIGKLGGVFRVTEGLQRDFGPQRVVDTPLAESGIIGTAIGLALRGYKPVCEIQFDGFVFPAYNQITTQLAKIRNRSGGNLQVPVVIRIPYGGRIGAVEHHSESPEVLFAHTAGLRVMTPASPQDAYTMIQQAIASPDPVIFFEPKSRYWQRGPVEVPEVSGPGDAGVGSAGVGSVVHGGAAQIRAEVIRPGRDVTVVAYGPSVQVALGAAATAQKEGRSVEVIDLKTISPLDIDTIASSVNRTGRLIVVHEAPAFYGAGAEIAAQISQRCFYSLQAPVLRVGGFHAPYPVAKLELDYVPDTDRVLDAIDQIFAEWEH